MSGTVPPLLLNAFMARTGITLALIGGGEKAVSGQGGLTPGRKSAGAQRTGGVAGNQIRT